jgi:hypothetical protein
MEDENTAHLRIGFLPNHLFGATAPTKLSLIRTRGRKRGLLMEF